MVSFSWLEVFKHTIDHSFSGHSQHGAEHMLGRLSGNTWVMETAWAFASNLFVSSAPSPHSLLHASHSYDVWGHVPLLRTRASPVNWHYLWTVAGSEHTDGAVVPRCVCGPHTRRDKHADQIMKMQSTHKATGRSRDWEQPEITGSF